MPKNSQKSGDYIKFLDKYLDEKIEVFNNDIIYQAYLLPNLSIGLVEEQSEKFYVSMNIVKDESGSKKVEFFISNNNPEIMKKILSEIYALSLNSEDFSMFIKSRNKRKYSDEN
jgi:hypothetical protein